MHLCIRVNPEPTPFRLGLVEALFGAMNHAAALFNSGPEIPELTAKVINDVSLNLPIYPSI